MRWEDADTLCRAIGKKTGKFTQMEKDVLTNARWHVDQRRDMNKSAELPLHALYRKAHGWA